MGEKRTASSRFPFTQNRLAALKPPDKGRTYHYDARTPGLCLCVTSAGARTFYLYRKVAGKPERLRLGTLGELTLDAARTAATAAAGSVAQGGNPAEERRQRRVQPTMGELWGHWLLYANAHKRPSSVHEDELKYKKYLAPLEARRLSTITKAEVQALHAKIGRENGPYQANRVLALLRSMLNKAEEIGYRGRNPATGVKMFAETARDRFLQRDELKRFFDALAGELPLFRDFFLVALLTGARRSNVQAMAWDDINLDVGIWRIPETASKSKKPMVVPLVGPVAAVLRTRQIVADGSPWVFPGRRGGHLTEPRFAWNRVVKRAGLSDIRPHDLRRSLGSWMAGENVSLVVIGKALGHSTPQATMVYSRLSVDPVREAMEKATTAMLTAGGQAKLLGLSPDGRKAISEEPAPE